MDGGRRNQEQKPKVMEGGIYPARGFSPARRGIDSLAGGFLESPAASVHAGPFELERG